MVKRLQITSFEVSHPNGWYSYNAQEMTAPYDVFTLDTKFDQPRFRVGQVVKGIVDTYTGKFSLVE